MSAYLGPVLFRKQLPKAAAVILIIFAAIMAGFVLSASKFDFGTIGLVAFALGLALMGVWVFSYSAAIHENGAATRHIFGTREVRFDQLKSFSYSRMIVNGAGQDTLVFTPHSGKAVRVVTQPSRGADQDLEKLADRLAEKFAAKMRADLDRRGRAAWLPRKGGVLTSPAVSLSRDGVVLNDGKGDRTLLFGEVEPQIANGQFLLKERGNGKTLVQRECAAENFYPGLKLFTILQAPQSASRTKNA